MAISTIQPYPLDRDLVTYKEAVQLFAETGHEVSASTLRRWVKERELNAEKWSGTVYVSWSDLLVAHGEWVLSTSSPIP
ncbi:hypothetical protein ACFWV1_26120 [Streptomyces sp. NPDC058700]|uniref:hypothetical protein n=1 Tax=Streptomyces sp. NPDC058700 TaxID=3346607 RepID=UPI003664A75B